MRQPISLHPPVRGQWAIFNPPGHPKLACDFLTVDDGKSPYTGTSLFRHIVSTISVESTLAWNQPVLAVMEGTVAAASDGMPDRQQLCMAKDLFRLMCFGSKPVPPFSALGGNYVIVKCGDVFPLAHLRNGSILCVPAAKQVDLKALTGVIGANGLSFGSADRLRQQLGVEPGAVTLLAVFNDPAHGVELFVDEDLWQADAFQFHPLVNTATLVLSRDVVTRFVELTGHRMHLVKVPERKL